MSHARSAEQIAAEESKRKAALLKWADETADRMIAAVLDDVALPFIEGDADDDEQLGAADLTGDYDPIIDVKTGLRLSDAIKQAAESLRTSEKMLRRVYTSALKQKWADHPKEIASEPTGKPYGRLYRVNRHGVWVQQQALAGLEDFCVWRRIAKTQIDLEAMSYDTTRHRNWQHRYRITNETGEFPVDIAHEHTGKDADSAIKILMRRGVRVVESREARRHLTKFLQIWPSKRIIRAPRTGWFEWRGRWVFVLPDEVLGVTDNMRIILDGTSRSGGYGFHRAGTSEQWRQQVALPLARHSNVVLAVGTMLAAPLLRWADDPGGGFHFYGDSKTGKTLIAVIGQSVWGKPFIPGSDTSNTFGYDWDTTSGRLEERAVLRNDVGLSLDGIEGGEKKPIASSIYTLASGQGRGRMGRSEASFNLMMLSTGEVSVVQFLDDVRVGQTVRLSDIPAEVEPGLGTAFEHFRPNAAGKQFYPATRDNHGAFGYDWLQYLVGQTPKNFQPRFNELYKAFLGQPAVAEILARAHSQVVSVIHRFAVVAATLALNIEANLLPWAQADTDTAIIACMRRWLPGNIEAAGELLREIERRRRIIAATIDDRFIRVSVEKRCLGPASAADQHKMQRADEFDGFVKNGHLLVTPEAWRRWWAGLNLEDVNKYLLKANLLIPDREGKASRAEKYNGSAPAKRFYVLASEFIEGVTV